MWPWWQVSIHGVVVVKHLVEDYILPIPGWSLALRGGQLISHRCWGLWSRHVESIACLVRLCSLSALVPLVGHHRFALVVLNWVESVLTAFLGWEPISCWVCVLRVMVVIGIIVGCLSHLLDFHLNITLSYIYRLLARFSTVVGRWIIWLLAEVINHPGPIELDDDFFLVWDTLHLLFCVKYVIQVDILNLLVVWDAWEYAYSNRGGSCINTWIHWFNFWVVEHIHGRDYHLVWCAHAWSV